MLEQYKKFKMHLLDIRAYRTQQKKRSLNWKTATEIKQKQENKIKKSKLNRESQIY